jgi:hypothetical protein
MKNEIIKNKALIYKVLLVYYSPFPLIIFNLLMVI